MAKLGTYFCLCPLIDHRGLLGVSLDNEECQVVVTLGKNIAMKYRLSDQKQILSWTTKEKFTSPVIYDTEINKYVAVFNYRYLRTWDESVEHLDKVKKTKFVQNIHTLFNCGGKTYLVFENGDVRQLNDTDTITGRLNENERIEDVLYNSNGKENYVGLVVNDSLFWKNVTDEEYRKILLKKDSQLIGITLHHDLQLLTLWADNKLYKTDLTTRNESLIAVINSLNCQEKVVLNSIDENYVAMYGADSNQEGASVIIYNLQFKLTQLKQPLKLYTIGAKMWNLNKRLYLTVGQNLSVLPYYLETEQISALIGSHKYLHDRKNQDVTIVSEVKTANWTDKIKKSKIEIAAEYLKLGYPEQSICEELIPDCIERGDLKTIKYLLNSFVDIPEKNLIDITLHLVEKNLDDDLLLVFSKRFNEITLLPHVRQMSVDQVIYLLRLISDSFENDVSLPGHDSIGSKIMLTEWTNVIVNACYQLFLIKKDKRVLDVLRKLGAYVDEEIDGLNGIFGLIPQIDLVVKQRNNVNVKKVMPGSYSIETISFS